MSSKQKIAVSFENIIKCIKLENVILEKKPVHVLRCTKIKLKVVKRLNEVFGKINKGLCPLLADTP